MYNKRRHYEPTKVVWKKSTVTRTIKTITNEVIDQAKSGQKWLKHPLDEGGQIKSDFYLGRSGALWAVDYLQRIGASKTKFDIATEIDQLIAENRKYRQRTPHPENSSYLFGEMPLLLIKFRQCKDPELAEDIANEIASAIQQNDDQPVRELMWGMAGSMLVALFMHKWTNEKRWEALYRKQAKRLLADWENVKGIGYLWNVDVYGHQRHILGPVHGFTGNAFVLIAGFHLLPKKQVEQITRRVMATIVSTADTDDQFANWWPSLESAKVAKSQPLVQFCHGAPGIIIPLASLPVGINTDFDEVLLKGGELIWHAGLLEKGPSLCHGTSGNGYAFLKLYKRTGNELWLKRARKYAMHSIEQYEEIKAHYNKPRFPLWTGDPGIAIYLWDCLQANADFPTLDAF